MTLWNNYKKLLPEKILEDLKTNLPAKIGQKKLKEVLELTLKEYKRMSVEPG